MCVGTAAGAWQLHCKCYGAASGSDFTSPSFLPCSPSAIVAVDKTLGQPSSEISLHNNEQYEGERHNFLEFLYEARNDSVLIYGKLKSKRIWHYKKCMTYYGNNIYEYKLWRYKFLYTQRYIRHVSLMAKYTRKHATLGISPSRYPVIKFLN